MKTHIFRSILCTSFLCFSVSSYAQSPFWISMGLSGKSVSSFTQLPNGRIFAFAESQIYSTASQGGSWDFVNTFDKSYALASDSIGNLYKHQGFVGTEISVDQGKSWRPLTSAGTNCFIGWDGSLYSVAAGFYKSTDQGSTWFSLSTLSPGTSINCWIIGEDKCLYAGTGYQWYTRTGGFEIVDGNISRSTNNGASWTKMSGELVDFIAAGFGGKVIFSSYYIENSSGRGNKVRTTRFYDFTTGIAHNLTELATLGYQNITFDSGNSIFMYNQTGIYRSLDEGLSWTPMMSGLDTQKVVALFVDDKDYLYAGTTNGIFRSVARTTSIIRSPTLPVKDYELSQNYPNPFNPSTIITYFVPISGEVTIQIKDILGRTITRLVDGRQSEGRHSVHWNANGIPSGVYYCFMKANGFSDFKKLLLVK